MSFIRKLFNPAHPMLPIGLYLIFGVACLTPDLSDNGDNASYITLSHSLMNGQGYINSFYPNSPPETQYPPLLPMLLLPILFFWGNHFLLLKLIPYLFGALGLVMIYRLLNMHTTPVRAWIATLLTAINASYLLYATDILTETLYVFLSCSALIAVTHLEKNKKITHLLLSGLVLAIAFYARTVGVALFVASCGFLFWKRQFSVAIKLGAIVGLLLLPWALRSMTVENSYFFQLTEQSAGESSPKTFLFLERMAHNLPRYAGKVFVDLIGGPIMANASPYHPIKIFCSTLFFCLFIWGWINGIRKKTTLIDVYLLVYLGIFAIWPYHDARFLVPILPFIFHNILSGIASLPYPKEVASKVQTVNASAMLLFGICVTTSFLFVYHNQTQFYTPETAHFRQACFWIKDNSPKEALVLSRKPRIASLWSERKGWWFTDGDRIPQTDDRGTPIFPTHIIVSNFNIAGVNLTEGFVKRLSESPHKYKLVYETEPPQVSVYTIQTQISSP